MFFSRSSVGGSVLLITQLLVGIPLLCCAAPVIVPQQGDNPAVVAEVSMYRGNPRRSGEFACNLGEFPKVAWSVDFEDGAEVGPAAGGGLVVQGLSSGDYVVLDANDGSLIRRIPEHESTAYSYPAIGEAVFFSPHDEAIALDVSGGRELWHFHGIKAAHTAPLLLDATVVMNSGWGDLVSVDRSSGAELWHVQLPNDANVWGGAHVFPVSEASGRVYAATDQGRIGCYDAQNGAELWSVRPTAASLTIPVLSGEADLVVMTSPQDSKLFALHTRDGSLAWEVTTAARPRTDVAISNGLVILGFDDGTVGAFRIADGALVWSHQHHTTVDSPPMVVGDRVFFGGCGPDIQALSLSTGTIVWKLETSGCGGFDNAFACNGGTLFAFANCDGVLWAIR